MGDIFDDDNDRAVLVGTRCFDDSECQRTAIEAVPVGLAVFFGYLEL